MKSLETTQNTTGYDGFLQTAQTIPVILIAHTPPGSFSLDRCALLKNTFTIGRDPSCDLSTQDSKTSKQHFRIQRKADDFFLEDMRSTNGTFVDGSQISKTTLLTDQSIIRAGKSLFVFLRSGAELLSAAPLDTFEMAGRFYTGPFIERLKMAAISGRHVLITGPSGTGKELAAGALCHLLADNGKPLKLLSYNAARFASEEEATTTLFGVGARVFSNVDARLGLIEQANKGALFLDEIHNLPERVQRSLLRVIEDGKTGRIGENTSRPCNVRFVLASNQEGPTRGLAHDLFARLRMVELPPLVDRKADIPSIFDSVLEDALARQKKNINAPKVQEALRAEHYETMCLDGFEDLNVRGVIDVADRIATYMAVGKTASEALSLVFKERFAHSNPGRCGQGPKPKGADSKYEQNKEFIIKTYHQQNENLSATERALKEQGLLCSRRWLRVFLEKWKIGDSE